MDPNKIFQTLQPLPISQMHSTPFRELTNLTPISFCQMQTPTGLFDNTLTQPGSRTKSSKQLTPSSCFESAQSSTAMFSITEDGIMTAFASSGSQELIPLNPPPTMPISNPIPVHQPANLDQLKRPREMPVCENVLILCVKKKCEFDCIFHVPFKGFKGFCISCSLWD